MDKNWESQPQPLVTGFESLIAWGEKRGMVQNMEIRTFEGGLRGVTVIEPVKKGDQLFYAPLSLMITEDFTKACPLASLLEKGKKSKK
jgi:hypothetical protein